MTVGAILAATLTPGGNERTNALLDVCVRCGSFWLQDAIANVVLYLPFGAFAALGGWRAPRITKIAGLMSVGIEMAQFFFVAGRDSSLIDVVTNCTGACLGAMMVYPAWRAIAGRGPAARRLLRAAGAGVVAFTVVVSGLMLPSRASTPVWAQLEPEREGPARANMAVTRASVNGRPLETGRVRWIPELREVLRRRDLRVEVDVNRVEVPAREWALIRLADPLAPDPVEIASSPRGWLGTVAWRSEDFGLRSATVRLPYSETVQGPLTLTLERNGAFVSLIEASASGRRSAATSLNATMVWIPFVPVAAELTGSFQWFGAVWVFGVVAMLGWWAGRSSGWRTGIEGAVLVLAAGGLPAVLFGMAAPPPWAWATALVAGALGAALGPRFTGSADPPSAP
jgi:hypothetical protein